MANKMSGILGIFGKKAEIPMWVYMIALLALLVIGFLIIKDMQLFQPTIP